MSLDNLPFHFVLGPVFNTNGGQWQQGDVRQASIGIHGVVDGKEYGTAFTFDDDSSPFDVYHGISGLMTWKGKAERSITELVEL